MAISADEILPSQKLRGRWWALWHGGRLLDPEEAHCHFSHPRTPPDPLGSPRKILFPYRTGASDQADATEIYYIA